MLSVLRRMHCTGTTDWRIFLRAVSELSIAGTQTWRLTIITADTFTMVVAHEFFDAIPIHIIEVGA